MKPCPLQFFRQDLFYFTLWATINYISNQHDSKIKEILDIIFIRPITTGHNFFINPCSIATMVTCYTTSTTALLVTGEGPALCIGLEIRLFLALILFFLPFVILLLLLVAYTQGYIFYYLIFPAVIPLFQFVSSLQLDFNPLPLSRQ